MKEIHLSMCTVLTYTYLEPPGKKEEKNVSRGGWVGRALFLLVGGNLIKVIRW